MTAEHAASRVGSALSTATQRPTKPGSSQSSWVAHLNSGPRAQLEGAVEVGDQADVRLVALVTHAGVLAGVLPADVRRAVVGGVVAHDNLEVGMVLRQQGVERARKESLEVRTGRPTETRGTAIFVNLYFPRRTRGRSWPVDKALSVRTMVPALW